jgi:hypothetical protein
MATPIMNDLHPRMKGLLNEAPSINTSNPLSGRACPTQHEEYPDNLYRTQERGRGYTSGNTNGESITVPLTSCLTGLGSAV